MAKINNETKLVLRLAEARIETDMRMMPNSYRDEEKLEEAWVSGYTSGQEQYSRNLKIIVLELQEN